MKKQLYLSVAALAALTAPVRADELALYPYIGLDAQFTKYEYNDNYDLLGTSVDVGDILANNAGGMNMHVGTRVGKHLGVELGYFRNMSKEKNLGSGVSTEIQTTGFTLDGMGYIPVTDDKRLELIGTAGAVWTKADLTVAAVGVGSETDDESEIGFRVGGGAQYTITDNMSARGLVRYQTADFDKIADHALTYSVGLNYSF